MRGMWERSLTALAVGLAVMSGLARGNDKAPVVVTSVPSVMTEEVTEEAPNHPRLHRLRPMAVKERVKEKCKTNRSYAIAHRLTTVETGVSDAR